MKYKMLSALIATALLSACGSDNDGSDSDAYEVKAYDPAVANMNLNYNCDGDTGSAEGVTDGEGKVSVDVDDPTICQFTLIARSNSVDMSNGKSMAGVTYIIPRNMAQAGEVVTASPLSTLLAQVLDGADYSEEAAGTLLMDLGLDALTTAGLSISEIMLDPEAAAASDAITDADKSKLLATTAVVSDVVKNAASDATPAQLTAAAESIAAATLETYPAYPMDDSGDAIYLEIPADVVAVIVADPTAEVELPEPEMAEPVTTPPTGGTGGTGAGGDDSTGA